MYNNPVTVCTFTIYSQITDIHERWHFKQFGPISYSLNNNNGLMVSISVARLQKAFQNSLFIENCNRLSSIGIS